MTVFFINYRLLIAVLAFGLGFAQQKTVSGRVMDSNGAFIPGVNVLVQGTSKGTQTDFDGNYKIICDEQSILVFSFMGMKEEQRPVAGLTSLAVIMVEDAEKLDEVVLLGYGKTTATAFTGSATRIENKNIVTKNATNISQALSGEVAGVRLFTTSGQPGSSATIRIRGFGSVSGSRDPLYVLDGVPFLGNIADINPGDIEDMVVLKDASATAIYGARGANGVVVVNTKKGKGKSYIELEQRIGQNARLLPNYNTISSPEEYIGLSWETLYNKQVAIREGITDPAKLAAAKSPEAYANENLFSKTGIDPKYNMWAEPNPAGANSTPPPIRLSVDKLIDPATRGVRAGVRRLYDPERWADYAFRYALRSETNLRMGGGNDKATYFTSLGYIGDQGYLVQTGYKRYTARANASFTPKKWAKTSVNMSYTKSESQNNGQSSDSRSVFTFVNSIPSIYPLFLRDNYGNIVKDKYYKKNEYDYGIGRGNSPLTNAISDAYYSGRDYDDNAFNGDASLDISFTKFLRLENKIGLQQRSSNYTDFGSPFFGSSASQGGSVYKQLVEQRSYNLLNLLRFEHTLAASHHIEALAAHEFNNDIYKQLTASENRLAVPFIAELNNTVVAGPAGSYATEEAIESYFSQLNYNYKETYFFSGTLRRDGSSRFVNNKWGNFWSVGASWIASNEDFMKRQDWISFLKLKTSYGTNANRALDLGEANINRSQAVYPSYDHYAINNLNDKASFSFNYKGNPDLTWESSTMFQVGAEFSLKKWVDINLDYYLKETTNLFYPKRVGPSSGYAIVYSNEGALRNSGLEFEIKGHILKGKNYFLDLSLNGQVVSSVITKLPIDPGTGKEKVLDISGSFARSKDKGLYDFYLREWAGVDPQNGRPQWMLYYDDTNANNTYDKDTDKAITSLTEYLHTNPSAKVASQKTYTYQEATQKYAGKSAIPDVTGAFNLDGGYKGISLRVQFIYGLGGYAYDSVFAELMSNGQVGSENWHTDIRNRWQKPGDVTDVPRIVSNQGTDINANSSSTRFLTRADYLQLNNISLGYTLSKSLVEKMKLQALSISASADNLWALTARRGFTPYTNQTGASSTYTYTPMSTFSLALKIKF